MAKQNLLNSVKISTPKKSVFDLSHDVKLSCNMGQLIPVMIMDCVPSDRVKISHESLVRLQPLVAPMMHRCDISFHTYAVPKRLLWPKFEKWVTNQKTGGVLPAFPVFSVGPAPASVVVTQGSLADYLGLPIPFAGGPTPEVVSAMPFAAYQMIYNEYYRDQNLIAPVNFELIDGDNAANAAALSALRKRAWEHDYFTAAAPTAQAGEPVEIPIAGGNLPVWINNAADTTLDGTPTDAVVAGAVVIGDPAIPSDSLYANADDLPPVTINELRTAFRLQEWLEKSMRGGRRLFENILVFFGLRSPDMRLQRPEYISGSKTPIQISEVLNTTGTAEAPQGTMAGHGVAVVQPKDGYYTCQEWCYIITIMSVMPKTAYFQGIERHWLKVQDPMEYYWPQFDHLGEQEINTREIMGYTTDPPTFGYIPRYAEYKFMNSRVAGEFRESLDYWHMARKFDTTPVLNQEFIESNPTHRVFAVTDEEEQKLLIHVYNKIKAIRPMSKYSTPTF